VGGWAQLRGHLDALDLSSPDARRAIRAAVGAMQPKALLSRRAWNALRTRLPRLPEPEVAGVGEQRKRAAIEEGAATPVRPRRRRRRRLRTDGAVEGATPTTAPTEGQPQRRDPSPPEGATAGTPGESAPAARKRRRRRRRPRGTGSGAEAGASGPSDSPTPPPAS